MTTQLIDDLDSFSVSDAQVCNLKIIAHNLISHADFACTCPALVNADYTKYVGVTIDTNLNFRKHIGLLCTRSYVLLMRKLIYF